MKTITKTISCAALVGAGACAPMEQAPLVYSSSQTIGLEVSAGEPESPAFDLIIGYGGKDRAFVPVAVSKFCRASSADYDNCLDTLFEARIIKGKNDVDGANRAGASGLARVQQDLTQLNSDLASAKKRLNELTTAQKAIAEVSKYEKDKASLVGSADANGNTDEDDDTESNADTLSPSQSERLSEIEGELKYRRGLIDEYGDAQDLEKKIDTAKQRISNLTETIRRREAERAALIAGGERLDRDSKEDALSVYGSFEGTAKGDKASGSIGVGKVFSTGVAAQNITQGIRKAAIATAAGNCIESGMTLIEEFDGAEKKAMIDNIFKLCEPRSRGEEESSDQ